MSAVWKALAEPRRQRILKLVSTAERSAGEIASHFDVTRPAVSQHLRVLEDAGLVTARRDGTRRLYKIRPEGLAALQALLGQFWDQQLDGLKRAAERAERKEGRGAGKRK